MPRCLLVLLVACGGDDDTTPTDGNPTDGTTDTGTTPTTTGDTGGTTPTTSDLLVTDANNYTLSTSWTVPLVEARAEYDVLVNWSAFDTDAWGGTRLPTDVQRLVLFELLIPPEDIPARLAADDFGGDLLSTWDFETGGAVFANLSDLMYVKTRFDPRTLFVENDAKSWMIALANRVGDRYELLDAQILVPLDASATTNAPFVEPGAAFTWSAALDGAPIVVAGGLGSYTVDWSGLATDALGVAYDTDRGDELFVARYDAGAPDGASVLALKDAADGWWTMDVAGDDSALLELARDDASATFGGFEAGGEWLMGVTCSTCLSPFPLWVVTVDVR